MSDSNFVKRQQEKLKRIIERNSGRSKPTESAKRGFVTEWVALANESGISQDAIDLLLDGFKIAGAEPFYRYVDATQNVTAHDELFSSPRANDNKKNETVIFGLNLLAFEIPSPSATTSIATIVEKYTLIATHANKSATSAISKSIGSQLVKPLMGKALPQAREVKKGKYLHGLLKQPLEDFIANDTISIGEARTAKQILNWLDEIAGIEHETEAVPLESGYESTSANLATKVMDIDSVISFLTQYRDEHTALAKSSDKTAIELKSANARIKALETQVNEKAAQLQSHVDRESSLESELAEALSIATDSNKEREAIRKQRDELELMLRTTLERKENKIDSRAKRMARKLKVEHDDFLIVSDTPMSSELGEMFREQLRTIFEILESHGVNL